MMPFEEYLNRWEGKAPTQTVIPPTSGGRRPFGMPPAPASNQTTLRDPATGATVTLTKWSTFGMTLAFGCFYLAYHEAWLHAAIALVLAFVTSALSWAIYPFFAYRILVDSYQRRGWVVVPA